MNIQLNLYEVETLEYVLDKFIFQQQKHGLDCNPYRHMLTMIKMQRENHTERLIDELKAQIKHGEAPSTVALQRQEGIGYGRAAKLIDQAISEVRMLAEARKEQEQ